MGKFKHDTYIPGNIIRDDRLKPKCKLIYSELLYYCDNKGLYYKNYNLFSKLYRVNRTTVMEYFKSLEKLNYIETINNKNYIVGELKSLNFKGKGFGDKVCEWCEINTVVIDKHHYPIPKIEGGKETINLCPTCHMAYHGFPDIIKITNLEAVKYVKKQYKKNKKGDLSG